MERVAITLPRELERIVEKKRKEIGVSRSEFFRKALKAFLGVESQREKQAVEKYGPIYEALNTENAKISKEMITGCIENVPSD